MRKKVTSDRNTKRDDTDVDTLIVGGQKQSSEVGQKKLPKPGGSGNEADTVRGYKVKVKYKTVPEAEKKTRKQAIAETILKALRRMKGKK